MDSNQFNRSQIIIVAGMPRAGTTFLYHNLKKHPEVFLPSRKETGYFSYHYDKDIEWYFSFFRKIRTSEITFDISGMYFFDPRVCQRIKEFLPEAKVILGVRDPRDWILSLFEQYKPNFKIPPLREFAMGFTIFREGKCVEVKLGSGSIERTIDNFRSAFGSQLLLYDFNLLGEDSLALLRGIEKFTGIQPFFKLGNYNDSKINARGRRRLDFFYKYMHKKGVADAVLKLIPRRLILSARDLMEGFSATKIHDPAKQKVKLGYSSLELQFIKEEFERDSRYVKEIFLLSPLVLGNGERLT